MHDSPEDTRRTRKQRAVRIAARLGLKTLPRRVLMLLAVTGTEQPAAGLVTEYGSTQRRMRTVLDQLVGLGLITTRTVPPGRQGKRCVQCRPLAEIEAELDRPPGGCGAADTQHTTQQTYECEECHRQMTGESRHRLRYCTSCLPLDPLAVHEHLSGPPQGLDEVELRVRLKCERHARGIPPHWECLTDEERARHLKHILPA